MEGELTDKEYVQIRDYIRQHLGINLGDEKKTLVYSRLRTILQEKGMASYSEYFKYLQNDKSGEALVQFIDKITTNHTFFMREADHFNFFRDSVLPDIERRSADKDLKLWCAACSSGEEPYTLEMIIMDYFKDRKDWNIDILATDISSNVLKTAVRGVYPNESVDAMPPEWKSKYFRRLDADYSVVADEVKKHVLFRKFNLMEQRYSFRKPFQVIFCRNVMIYFDAPTREEVVQRLYDCHESGGYLFIGHSESLSGSKVPYKYIMPAVYKKQ